MRATPNLQRSLRYLLAWAPTVAVPRAMPAQRPVPDAALESGTLSFVGRATAGDFVGTTTIDVRIDLRFFDTPTLWAIP